MSEQCAEDGHCGCTDLGRPCCTCSAMLRDYGPRQATDPRKRAAMENTGRTLGDRRDV